jgi:biopolymer transport protein ExbD
MAFQTQARSLVIAEMNITPLVDVMLVLLIIFMVATPMLTRSLTIDFPSVVPDPLPPPPEPDPITLQVEADGSLLWNGHPMSLTAVDASMRIEASREVAPKLRIEISDDADYRHVATVLGRAKHAGLEKIALPF